MALPEWIYVGTQKAGREQSVCRIFLRPDGTYVAENPAGPGYNWVQTGTKYLPVKPSAEVLAKVKELNR